MKFINKMATGEVSVEGNQVIDNGPIASDVDAWASEFETGNFLKGKFILGKFWENSSSRVKNWCPLRWRRVLPRLGYRDSR